MAEEKDELGRVYHPRGLTKLKTEWFFPWQIEGIRWATSRYNYIIGDEMGLGKSLQTLTVAAIDFQKYGAKRMLIVCQKGLKWNWAEEEIRKHTHFTYHVLEGTPTQRTKQIEEFNKDILIVSYEQVNAHWQDLNKLKFDLIAYDEAHQIKGFRGFPRPGAKKKIDPKTGKPKKPAGSVRARSSHHLQAKRHIPMTGSWILNHADDLWSLLNRVAPAEFPNYYTFCQRYIVYGGYRKKQRMGVKNEKELKRRIEPYVIRREADLLPIPPKMPPIIEVVQLTKEQRLAYDQVKNEIAVEHATDPDAFTDENTLVRFLRLKQIVGTTASIPGLDDHSAKLDRAVDIIVDSVENNKHIVIFTQFRAVLECLERRLKEAGLENVYTLHGDIKPEARMRDVQQPWQEGPAAPLIAMYQVGGVGLNFVKASRCILLDKLFQPKLNEQAIARLYRLGQTRRVQVYELRARNTVDTRIEDILQVKRDVFDAISGQDSAWKRKFIEAVLANNDVEFEDDD